jgi:hypothetical protein
MATSEEQVLILPKRLENPEKVKEFATILEADIIVMATETNRYRVWRKTENQKPLLGKLITRIGGYEIPGRFVYTGQYFA